MAIKTNQKNIKDWERVFLDTSIICALFRSQDNSTNDEQTLFVRKLITYLSTQKTSDGKERVFLISTITISELLTREQDSDKIKRILKVLDSKNVEFVDFDLETALQLNAQLYPYLSRTELHKMAAEIGFRTTDYMMAREWIHRDFMIIMNAVTYRSDVILTADKNTFYPATEKVNDAYCVLAYPELFEHSEKFVLRYYDDKVDAFIKTPRINNQPKEAKPAAPKPFVTVKTSTNTNESKK